MFNQNEEENVLEKYGRNIIEDVKNRKIDPELKHFSNSKILQTIIKWLFFCQIFNFSIA